MKRYINQETVMLVVLCLVVLAVLFGATVAWFMNGSPVTIEEMGLSSDDLGDLYVWVKTEEESETETENVTETESMTETESVTETESMTETESITETESEAATRSVEELMAEKNFTELKKVGTGDDVHYKIDMHLVKQENIQEKTFAPGAYGKVVFKILSKTSLIKGYRIKITPSVKAVQKMPAGFTEEDLLALVKSHIKFYAALDEGKYSQVILYSEKCALDYETSEEDGTDETTAEETDIYTNGLTGDIEEDEIKYITLYWYWPYEYVDIPECLDILNEDSLFFDEFKEYTYNQTEEDGSLTYNPRTLKSSIEEYDWDDTYIGNLVEQLMFHFDVETIR